MVPCKRATSRRSSETSVRSLSLEKEEPIKTQHKSGHPTRHNYRMGAFLRGTESLAAQTEPLDIPIRTTEGVLGLPLCAIPRDLQPVHSYSDLSKEGTHLVLFRTSTQQTLHQNSIPRNQAQRRDGRKNSTCRSPAHGGVGTGISSDILRRRHCWEWPRRCPLETDSSSSLESLSSASPFPSSAVEAGCTLSNDASRRESISCSFIRWDQLILSTGRPTVHGARRIRT